MKAQIQRERVFMLILSSLPVMAEAGLESWKCETDGHYYPLKDGKLDITAEGVELEEEADCTKAAVYSYTCLKCHQPAQCSYGDPIAHTKDANATETYYDKTCLKAGYWLVSKCATCGNSYERVDTKADAQATGHNWVDGTVVEPTCTTPGYTPQTCSACGATQKVNEKEKLNHKFAESTVEVDIAPTCYSYGYKGKAPYCERPGCNAVDTAATTLIRIDKLTHTAADGADFEAMMDFFFTYADVDGDGVEELVQGISTADGLSDPYKKVENLVVKAGTGHPWAYGDLEYTYIPATCDTEGSVTVKCLGCKVDGVQKDCGVSSVITKTIAPLDHVTDVKTEIQIGGFTDTLDANENAIYVVSVKYVAKDGEVVGAYDMNPPVHATEFKPDFYLDLYDCTEEMIVHYECALCNKTWDGESWSFNEHIYEKPVKYTQVNNKDQVVVVYVGDFIEEVEEGWLVYHIREWENAFDYIDKCTDYEVEMQCIHCQQTKPEKKTGAGHEVGDEDAYMVQGSEFRASTCTMPGADWYTCSECGISLLRTVPPLLLTIGRSILRT